MSKIDFLSDINRGYESALNYQKIDRFIVGVLWWHLGIFAAVVFLNAVVKLASFYPSPLSWRVIGPQEAFVAVLVGILATVVPLLCKDRIAHYPWRVIVTIALTVYSYLFVFISGGSIEMHFHFFIITALLVIYADWRLGWILLVLTGLHHGILNYVEPGWVYYYGRNDFAVIAHALPVFMVVIFTTVLCQIGRESVVTLKEAQKGMADKTVELEKLKSGLEETVVGKTDELKTKIAELKKINELMIGRELKMVELKKEIDILRSQQSHA